jgi:hypothetical protein
MLKVAGVVGRTRVVRSPARSTSARNSASVEMIEKHYAGTIDLDAAQLALIVQAAPPNRAEAVA